MELWMRNQAKYKIALNLVETKGYESAIEYLDKEIKLNPIDELLFCRGRIYRSWGLSIGHHRQSRKYFEKSLRDYECALEIADEEIEKQKDIQRKAQLPH